MFTTTLPYLSHYRQHEKCVVSPVFTPCFLCSTLSPSFTLAQTTLQTGVEGMSVNIGEPGMTSTPIVERPSKSDLTEGLYCTQYFSMI